MKVEQANWDNEGGHVRSTRGQVVRTPGGEFPYKVVLSRNDADVAHRPFATMREAEAFIRGNTPRPAARCTLFDRAAGEGLGATPSLAGSVA